MVYWEIWVLEVTPSWYFIGKYDYDYLQTCYNRIKKGFGALTSLGLKLRFADVKVAY